MYDYYFKIKKGDIEFECSTTDKNLFEQKLSDWINGIVQGSQLSSPNDTSTNEQEEKSERSGFIDVKNLTSINEIQTTDLEFKNETDIIDIQSSDFEMALNSSMNNPMTEVIEKKESSSNFEEFYTKYSPESALDKLIVTSLYILNEENIERFTLKTINSKLVPLCGSPVDHSVIQDAIEQEYVKVVPDLTDTSEYTEYTLTQAGEEYYL